MTTTTVNAAAAYEAPQVRIVEVRVEKGFAVSGVGDDIPINR